MFILFSRTDENSNVVYEAYNSLSAEQKQRYMELHAYMRPQSQEVRLAQIRKTVLKTAWKSRLHPKVSFDMTAP